jgi:hypothetical protein
MKTLKRMLVTLVAMAMMVAGFSTLAFAAASPSVTSIKKATVSLSASKLTYNGKNQSPSVTVKYKGEQLVEGTDYTVSVDKSQTVGKYTVTVTGMGLFEGTVDKTYKITADKLSTVKVADVTYTGSKQTAKITVKDSNGNKLTEGTDYTVTGTVSRTKVGTNELTITGIGNYTGTKTVSFKVNQASLSDATATATAVVYNGKAQTATIVVTDANGNTLEQGTDYTVSANATSTAPKTYSVTITGKGNYKGTTKASFKIGKGSIGSATIDVTNVTYNGSKQTAQIKVTDKFGNVLTEGKDYSLKNAKQTDAGTYTVTVAGKGNYYSDQDVSFKIGKASVSKLKVTVKAATYTGKAQAAKVTVKTADGKTLKANKDYTVTNVSKTNAGTYTVTINGKGNYYSSTDVDFTIAKAEQAVKATVSGKTSATVKASDLKKKAKTLTLKVSKAQGKITYATSSKNITVKNGKITIAKGTPAGTYRVRVKVAGTANYEEADDQIITITVK